MSIDKFKNFKDRKFFKITNSEKKETYNEYTYVDGLNIAPKDFIDEDMEDVGLHYTIDGFTIGSSFQISEFYHYGDTIREVTLPFDNKDFRIEDWSGWRSDSFPDSKRVTNMIILGEKHSLNDINTYIKFELEFGFDFSLKVIASVDLLEKWKKSGLPLLKYEGEKDIDPLCNVSYYVDMKIDGWWKTKNNDPKDHINILYWWKNSGLAVEKFNKEPIWVEYIKLSTYKQ